MIISGLALLAFLISYNIYLFELATQVCDMRIMKLWNYYSIGALLLWIFINEANDFISVSKIVVIITILTIILTNHAIIKNPYYSLGIIDLGTAIVTLMILIAGYRHGIFSK